MADSTKDTIYIDIDDEITGIIDKVTSSKHKITALVLPKRAATLQSIVNMKLLKRAGTEAKKHVVLITSEVGLLPLAGAVGLHVAKTPQSKPYIPSPPDTADPTETVISEIDAENIEPLPIIDNSRPVGELAGLPPPPEDETIEVDNSDPTPALAAGATAGAAAKKSKKFKIPNFERFRTKLFIGIAAFVALVIAWVLFAIVLPKATITVKTDTTSVTSDVEFTASAAATEFDPAAKVLPAELEEIQKTEAEKVPATGEKDVGTKASGSVKLTNCNKDDETITVPAGTGVSANNLTFITSAAAKIPPSNFTGGGTCKNDSSEEVPVVAQNNGDQYNLAAQSYSVAGFDTVKGAGSAMSGGTSKVIKVVTDQDVASAREKIGTRAAEPATKELQQVLQEAGLSPLNETLVASQPALTASPTVGQEANEVTVTSITTYSMLGAKEDDLKKLIEEAVKAQIDTEKQKIQDLGLSKAVFRVLGRAAPGEASLSVQTVTVAGPEFDTESLKQAVAGKKRGEVQSIIQDRPGVREVNVEYSPFWVLSTPKRASNINIILEQANGDPANSQP